MIRDVVNYWEHHAGESPTDGMVVIGADNAPLWRVCRLFHKAVMHGASVIAIGPGTSISTCRKEYIVAYSLDEQYPIGSHIPVDLIMEDDLGPLPTF